MEGGGREQVKNQVREAADIVEVIGACIDLRKVGNRYQGLCPFHNEKTPSFSVNPQEQFFYCFGCGASGDVFSFVMKHHHCDFPEALKMLAQRYHIELPERRMSDQEKKRLRMRERLYQTCEEAARLYEQCLVRGQESVEARTYLKQRGVPDAFVRRYRLGLAPSPKAVGWSFQTRALRRKQLSMEVIEQAGLAVKRERGGHYDRFRSRIMFPILDMSGRVVAFGGRILGDGKPKYMNSPESPIFEKSRLLFGLYQHREAIRAKRTAIVVEGNFDLLMLAVHGVDNAVAPLGTSLTPHHVRQMRNYCDQAVLLFDGDTAGLQAAMRSVPYFLAENLECKVAMLPENHDPDSFVREKGASGIEQCIEEAQPLAEFVFDTLVQEHGLTLLGKNRIMEKLKPLLREAKNPAQYALMATHFGAQLGIDLSLLQDGKTMALPRKQSKGQEAVVGRLPKKLRQLFEFLLLHPDSYQEMAAAGLASVVKDELSVRILHLINEFCLSGAEEPEKILDLTEDDTVREHVVELLTHGLVQVEGEDESGLVESMRVELLRWIEDVNAQNNEKILQERIDAAERAGDQALLMELLQKKMLIGKKRKGY
ncbi:MAG: DNA primase [Desulfobulbus propionicus]|nr:MAG: DNA primase [Desulfobulbus propionicus]